MEVLALFALIAVGIGVVAVLAILGLVFKLAFKLLLIPFWILFAILKVALVLCLVVGALVFAPLALVFVLLCIPVLVIAGLCGVGWAVFA